MTFEEYAQERGYILRPDTEFPLSWWVECEDNPEEGWALWMSRLNEPDRDRWDTIIGLWDAERAVYDRVLREQNDWV